MKVKIITCIFSNLYGSKFGGREHRKDHYRFSLLSLLKMSNADFLCYTSESEIEELKSFFYETHKVNPNQLEFKTFELKDCKYSDLINSVRDEEGSKKSDRCIEIQYSKFSWFLNEDKTYDYYFWFDAGLSHCGIIPNKYLSNEGYRGYFESSLFNNKFLDNLLKITDDSFLIMAKENHRNYWEGTVDPKFYNIYDNSVHIVGGLFGGKTHTWEKIVTTFEYYIDLITNDSKRLYFEEHIMSLMYQNHKEWFKTINFDIWWHRDNFKDGSDEFFEKNKSFYKMFEELNDLYE